MKFLFISFFVFFSVIFPCCASVLSDEVRGVPSERGVVVFANSCLAISQFVSRTRPLSVGDANAGADCLRQIKPALSLAVLSGRVVTPLGDICAGSDAQAIDVAHHISNILVAAPTALDNLSGSDELIVMAMLDKYRCHD